MTIRSNTLLAFALLCACTRPTAPAQTPTNATAPTTAVDEAAFPGGRLPMLSAANASTEVPADAPTVTVVDHAIRANDLVVGDVDALLAKDRLDPLRGVLAETRKAWISAHAGEPFPAVVVFRLDRGLRAPVVKRLARNAGMAGYVEMCVVVVTDAHEKRCLEIGVDTSPIPLPRVRLLARERFSVSWSPAEITGFPALVESARTELKDHGGYGIVLDPSGDLDLAAIVTATNALAALPQVSIATD